MPPFLGFIFFTLFGLLVLGIINPAWILPRMKKPSRRLVAVIWLGSMVVITALGMAVSEPASQRKPVANQNEQPLVGKTEPQTNK